MYTQICNNITQKWFTRNIKTELDWIGCKMGRNKVNYINYALTRHGTVRVNREWGFFVRAYFIELCCRNKTGPISDNIKALT